MDIGKLIGHLITVGLVLASLGALVEVTLLVREEAVATHRHGMVRLGDFNRRLQRGR